jgi:hypothetical protein
MTPVQRKVAKTVKKMRHLGIIPYVGLLKPTDKIPVGSYIEDLEEMHKKTVDPVTGRLFMKYNLQTDLRVKRQVFKQKFDNKIQDLEGKEQFESD